MIGKNQNDPKQKYVSVTEMSFQRVGGLAGEDPFYVLMVYT